MFEKKATEQQLTDYIAITTECLRNLLFCIRILEKRIVSLEAERNLTKKDKR